MSAKGHKQTFSKLTHYPGAPTVERPGPVGYKVRGIEPSAGQPPFPQPSLAVKVDGVPYRTIWLAEDGWSVHVIDQTRLPHELDLLAVHGNQEVHLAHADAVLRTMVVRGAPLIGATAAYGLCLGLRADPSDEAMDRAYETLAETRPTAVNLKWALDDLRDAQRVL